MVGDKPKRIAIIASKETLDASYPPVFLDETAYIGFGFFRFLLATEFSSTFCEVVLDNSVTLLKRNLKHSPREEQP